MRKRMIAIVLTGMLIAVGLGSFAYALEEPVNEVGAEFSTNWEYRTSGDTFTNGEVTGEKHWYTWLHNRPHDTGEPVYEPIATLDSGLTFDEIQGEEYLTTMGPQTYVWSFDDVPEDEGVDAGVGFWSPSPYTVTFTPGFDASRSADITEFSQSDGMQIQTLTVMVTPMVTPQEQMKELAIGVEAEENGVVNPVIISATTDGPNVWLELDEHELWITVHDDAGISNTCNFTITIEVTPKVELVEFMPEVRVEWSEVYNSGTTSGSSVLRIADPDDAIGTWTWSAAGSYEWEWLAIYERRVTFTGYSGNRVWAGFNTYWAHIVQEDTFTNGQVVGYKSWLTSLYNEDDETAAPVTASTLSLNSLLEFNMLEWEGEYLTQMGPPTYEWFFGDVAEGTDAYTVVAFIDSPNSPNPFPVISTPGFDASRILDRTEFLQSEGTQTQTLTITLTPQQQSDRFSISVWAFEDDLVNPVITSPATPDGHYLWIDLPGLEIGTTYTYYVTIEVTPKVPQIVFMPHVFLELPGEILASGAAGGSSLSYPAGEVGTWTWSAEGNYAWNWEERLYKGLEWWYRSGEIVYTPEGTNVEVAIDGSTITFGEVTTSGDTVVATSSTGPPIPTLFKLGDPPTYYDFTTTATYDPPVTVCIDYSGIQFGDEGQLRLFQWSGADWADITTSVDTLNDIICGQTSSLSIFAIVEPNQPPIAQAGVDPYLAPVGSLFTFDGSASYDPDGTIVSYAWDFGDGNSDSGALVTHSYAAPGLYDVVLTVTDDMGAQSTDRVMAVVYDPQAGFATGGGWLIPGGPTSDLGDMLPGLDNTSPANFGFVVKYKPGATTPSGQLEFQYRQGDFNLHSSGMEWLVIVNNNWAKFQGIAAIKGLEGLFPFRVDARDGDFGGGDQPDRFIIKVYAPGADPDSDEPIYKASGDLEGGNIVIHAKK